MRQWRQTPPLVIEAGDGPYLIDTEGRRYIDGVSSLWCNVHGHRVPSIDDAVRQQLNKIAHTTLLGLASPPSIELAARLVERVAGKSGSGKTESGSEKQQDTAAPPSLASELPPFAFSIPKLNKVFYSDAGATALEVAFKMAVGHWHHRGQPEKTRFIGLAGAYHGDTVGSMSVGYSDLFHRAFASMTFPVDWFPAPDALRPPHADAADTYASVGRSCGNTADLWPSEDPALAESLSDHCLSHLQRLLEQQADRTAAVVIEPIMQGAAGMICQPPGFLRRVRELATQHGVLLIADEVAVGFGRTGRMFACEHEHVAPDILCLAKGLTAGYLPLAVTMTSDDVYDAFTGEPDEKRTLYHGHTYTGNPLACAAALASLDLFDQPTHGSPDLITHTQRAAELIHAGLGPLRDCPHVADVRQRGLMVGIELGANARTSTPGKTTKAGGAKPFDFSQPHGHRICHALRDAGVIIRPLGNVIVLMPIPATPLDVLDELVDKTVAAILDTPLSTP
jgi:adenosylmethionine-8-amino-7-oxononanoate aminotransferase